MHEGTFTASVIATRPGRHHSIKPDRDPTTVRISDAIGAAWDASPVLRAQARAVLAAFGVTVEDDAA